MAFVLDLRHRPTSIEGLIGIVRYMGGQCGRPQSEIDRACAELRACEVPDGIEKVKRMFSGIGFVILRARKRVGKGARSGQRMPAASIEPQPTQTTLAH